MSNPFVERSARRFLLLAAVVASALGMAFGVGIAWAADQRLDEADLALQKARALLEASQTGGNVSDKAQHRFDRAVARAVANIDDARAQIVKAKEAVDQP